jgi:prephenate dehydratase
MPIATLQSSQAASPRTVAFAGQLGAFSEEAITTLWPAVSTISTRSVGDVVRVVSTGEADAGVLPVENTVAGGVVAAYDALAEAPRLHVIAETVLRVHQCLLGLPGSTLAGIQVVHSHPVALAQCSKFLATLRHVREEAASDTASAARAVAESHDATRAAIASRHAAARYGLAILAESVEDRPDNQTRFLVVARSPVEVAAGTPARTSVVFTTANEPGALLRALEAIAREALNLSRLESRPTGEPWTYRFFADIDHDAGDERRDAAIDALIHATQTCRILGTYARATA